MKWLLAATVGVALASSAVVAHEIERNELRRTVIPGSDQVEVIVSELIVQPGATVPLHTHPGDEHTIVVETTTATTANGDVVEFEAGTTLYFPEGEVHGGLTNIGETSMRAITIHVLRAGEPFATIVE